MDVNIADHAAVISFTNYYKGATPALIVNHTPWVTIGYKQRFVLGCYMLSLMPLLVVSCSHTTHVRSIQHQRIHGYLSTVKHVGQSEGRML